MAEEKPKSLAETMSEEWDKKVAEEDQLEEPTDDGDEEEAEEELEAGDEEVAGDEVDDEEPEDEGEGEEEEITAAKEEKPSFKPGDLAPLEHWSAEDKETFSKLPREAQDFLISKDKKFQAHYTRKLQEVSEIKRALEPVRQEIEYFGVTEADAIRRLIGAHKMLQQKPAEAIRFIADSYGLDINQLMSGQAPEESAAVREVHSIRQQMAERERMAYMQRVQAWEQQIEMFKKDHEFFEAVEDDIALIAQGHVMRNEPIPSLADMYDRAIYANPTVRQRLLAKEKSTERQKRLADEKARARKAKRAAGAKVRSTSVASEEKSKGPATLREALSEAWDQAEQQT